ncbi:MAG: energy-coupling factor transporter transmembrane protein EcfT, partial [Ruminococcus sp.]|nr:energy-coupling factor transporter transmembrane protein EcfT [Ruminococcus sp.]
TSLLNLFYGSGEPIWQWWIFKITVNGINRAVFVTTRIICLILASSCLTFTTSPTELTDAIERLMKPLRVIHFPVHEIAMMMSLALRFVPTLLEETDKIMQAQKARGADMESGNLIRRVKALVPVLIPLFVSAFRRAYDVATAMECRCYRGGAGRTRMKQIRMARRDAAAFVVMALVIGGVIVCNILFKTAI